MIITELNDQVELEMDALVRQGVTSFKLFMAYPGVFMLDDASIFRALLRTGKNGGTICMHAENGGVIDVLVKQALAEGKTAPKYHALTRPARAEAEATHRAIALAEIADVPIYIVHLSAAEALEMVTEARDRGLPAFAETCPQYLFLSYDNYEEPGFDGAKYVMSPPLRAQATQDQLWRGLAFNDLQAISTDHCPFCMKEQKTMGEGDFSKIPNGAPGIETRMSLVYDGGVRTGRISLNRFVELTSTSPAKIFGLFPRKGTIAPGSDADIVDLRSDEEDAPRREDAAHEGGLQPLRRARGHRRDGDGHLARTGRHRRREVRRTRGRRRIPAPQSTVVRQPDSVPPAGAPRREPGCGSCRAGRGAIAERPKPDRARLPHAGSKATRTPTRSTATATARRTKSSAGTASTDTTFSSSAITTT